MSDSNFPGDDNDSQKVGNRRVVEQIGTEIDDCDDDAETLLTTGFSANSELPKKLDIETRRDRKRRLSEPESESKESREIHKVKDDDLVDVVTDIDRFTGESINPDDEYKLRHSTAVARHSVASDSVLVKKYRIESPNSRTDNSPTKYQTYQIDEQLSPSRDRFAPARQQEEKCGHWVNINKQIPATAPLLTTERTNVRIAKRSRDENSARGTQERHVDNGIGNKWRNSRNSATEETDSRQSLMVMEDGEEILYESLDMEEDEFMEQHFNNEEQILFSDADVLENQTIVNEEIVTDGRMMSKMENENESEINFNESNDDDAPPKLVPQSPHLEKLPETEYVDGVGEVIRVQTPNGTEQLIHLAPGQTLTGENSIFVEENESTADRLDLRAVEFNFLDTKNICCGLCGEIVPYDSLMDEHLPLRHPEVLDEGNVDFETMPYEMWLKEKLSSEKRRMESGFRNASINDSTAFDRGRAYRNVSQVRVNPSGMSLNQLLSALRKKMYEKMGRSVPVTLVDKQHARCGICNAVVSLNKKFEVVHLVRHFNAWHPSTHQCAGKWKLRKPQPGMGRPLTVQDFAVIDTSLDSGANLQCIWCGMFMTSEALAMHFSEVHPEEIEVPRCNLCLQELVINARLTEKFGDEFDISLPNEHRITCGKFGTSHTSEARLHAAVEKRMRALQKLGDGGELSAEDMDDDGDEEDANSSNFLNSRMSFGRRSKPKRQFIMPALRQAAPANSRFVEQITECHWKCKLCRADILAAVISAGAIRHYRTEHPYQLEEMQYELCRTRLERISDGCMEFVHPQLIECLVCNLSYMLHKPFNMCRAIRHLKAKHPDLMPEYSGIKSNMRMTGRRRFRNLRKRNASDGITGQDGIVNDPATIAMLKARYNVEFEKVRAIEGSDGEPVYVLIGKGEDIDAETEQHLAQSIAMGDFVESCSEKTQEPSTSVPVSAAAAAAEV